ncbi:hypothetical protein KDA11_01610 [Candidatus Saccharibacteria bacterium]|nr:hypothetical protein [Candidatus Saccharibacteria bacterium]
MANVSNLYVAGGSLVTFGGVDLGHTVDGAEIEIERELTEVKTDIYGNTPVDLVVTGQKATVKLKLAEIVPNVLAYAIPESDYDVGSADDHIHFGTKAGYSLRADAYELIIKPQAGNADDAKTVTLFKAVSSDNVSFAYKIDEQSVYEVTFTALVDESRSATDGRLLGRVGPALIS